MPEDTSSSLNSEPRDPNPRWKRIAKVVVVPVAILAALFGGFRGPPPEESGPRGTPPTQPLDDPEDSADGASDPSAITRADHDEKHVSLQAVMALGEHVAHPLAESTASALSDGERRRHEHDVFMGSLSRARSVAAAHPPGDDPDSNAPQTALPAS